MNKELQKFIEWIPQNIEEMKDKTPDEIVEVLNNLGQSDEGKKMIETWMSKFKNSTSMFKDGGKMESLVNILKCGGKYKIRKGEDGLYNRVAAREQKQQFWDDETNEYGDTYSVRRTGDQNVLAKKVKAMNIDGFDPSMYNMDPNQKFDRQRYRDRKAIAREQHPEWTRRQRKAWALRDYDDNPMVNTPEDSKIYFEANIPIQERHPLIDIPSMNFEEEDVNLPLVKIPRYSMRTRVADVKPVSFNQFAGLLDDRLTAYRAFRNGPDLQRFQNWRAAEYERYSKDPLSYKWRDMDDDYVAKDEDVARYRRNGILANNRSTGYYDPNATDISSLSLFTDKTISDILKDQGYDSVGVKNYLVDENGNEVTDPNILLKYGIAAPYKNNVATTVTKHGIRPIQESEFSKAMSNLALGIAAGAGLGAMTSTGASASLANAVKNGYTGLYRTGKGLYNVDKDILNNYIQFKNKVNTFGEYFRNLYKMNNLSKMDSINVYLKNFLGNLSKDRLRSNLNIGNIDKLKRFYDNAYSTFHNIKPLQLKFNFPVPEITPSQYIIKNAPIN